MVLTSSFSSGILPLTFVISQTDYETHPICCQTYVTSYIYSEKTFPRLVQAVVIPHYHDYDITYLAKTLFTISFSGGNCVLCREKLSKISSIYSLAIWFSWLDITEGISFLHQIKKPHSQWIVSVQGSLTLILSTNKAKSVQKKIYSRYKAGQNVHGVQASTNTYDLHEQTHRKVLWGSTQSAAYHYILLTCISAKEHNIKHRLNQLNIMSTKGTRPVGVEITSIHK